MKTWKKVTLFVLFVCIAFTVHSLKEIAYADETDECIDCHQKEMVIHSFKDSCLSCHNNDMTGLNITKTITSETEEINTNCIECHSKKFDEIENNEHGSPGLDCIDCHEPHPTGTNNENLAWEETISIEESTTLCESCHPASYKSWKEKVHGDSDLDCTSCHDPHEEPGQIRASISSTPQLTYGLLILVVIGFLIFEVLAHKVIYQSAKD